MDKEKRIQAAKTLDEDWFDEYKKDKDLTKNMSKIIHQVWVGDKPIPDNYKVFMETWKTYHPKWTYILWTDENINTIQSLKIGVLNKLKNVGAKSDYIRYCALYDMGGLYVDTDFECMKPHDEFLNLKFFTTRIPHPNPNYYIGHIGSCREHPLMKRLKDGVVECNSNKADDVFKATGPYYFSDTLLQYVYDNKSYDKMVGFPVRYFYSFSHHERAKYKTRESRLKLREQLDAYGIHHYGTSWV